MARVDGLSDFCQVAEMVLAATNPAGLSLYAGVAAESKVDDPSGRAFQLITVLRELRGGVHLIAVLASGLAPEVAHAIKRPNAVKTFGWDPAPAYTKADCAKLDEADTLTDSLLVASYEGLDAAASDAFVSGIVTIGVALGIK